MKELVGVSHVSPPPSAFASAQPPRSVFADAQAPPSDSEPEPDSARSRQGASDPAPHPKAAQACGPCPDMCFRTCRCCTLARSPSVPGREYCGKC